MMFLAFIGAVVLANLLLKVVSFIYRHFLRPGRDLAKEYGEWAVVTGATDGIGKAMAQELSRKGMKVLLISRDIAKLQEVAKRDFPEGKVEVLAVDYSKDVQTQCDSAVRSAVAGKDIGVLVNNVGISYEHPEYFHELDADRVGKLMTMNVDSTTWMTHTILPTMLKQNRGCIVNMSSGAAAVKAGPLLAEYCAAKNYVSSFTKSLAVEYSSKNIKFQVQCPMYVVSKLSKFKKATFSIVSPEVYAKEAVKFIGYEPESSPVWIHDLMLAVSNSLPEFLVNGYINSMHKTIRGKALKKKQQAQKGE